MLFIIVSFQNLNDFLFDKQLLKGFYEILVKKNKKQKKKKKNKIK